MNNEPVAWIKQNPETLEAELHFDKPAKYWATVISNPAIPLYTHPSKHDLGIAEAIGFDKGYAAAQAKTLTDEDVKYNVTVKWDDKTTHHTNVLEDTPLPYTTPKIKELTDEEITQAWAETKGDILYRLMPFARAILRKAQEK